MTVFETRMSEHPSLGAPRGASTRAAHRQVGWVAALGWPAVWTAVLAGALLGPTGLVLLCIGLLGVVVLAFHQTTRLRVRPTSTADPVVESSPREARHR